MQNQSAGNGVDSHVGDEQGSAQSSKRHKMLRACIACRSTKTRCIQAEAGDSCEACLKKSRPCVMPGPAKPRLKSSEKFHELEKRIEILTNALAAKAQPATPSESRQSRVSSEDLLIRETTFRQSEQLPSRQPVQYPIPPSYNNEYRTMIVSQPRDVIDQGFVDIPTAEVLFNHYNISMHPVLPILDISPDHAIDRVRKTKPMSFLAILAISSASILPSFEPRLVMELNEQLARHIFILGTQSLDLVQAMVLYSQYYIRPSSSQTLAQTQYVSSAVAMSYDLSLHRDTRRDSGKSDKMKRETSRTWLACWYASSTNATVLQQPRLIVGASGVENSLQILGAQPGPNAGDEWLVSLIRLQQLIEEVTAIFGPMSHKAIEEWDDSNAEFKLQMSRQRLEKWRLTDAPLIDQSLKDYATHFADLGIHHVAIRNYVHQLYSSTHSGGSPTKTHASDSIPPSWYLDALRCCLKSSHALLNLYLNFEASLARSLPNMYLVWSVFAAFSLVKLGHLATVFFPVPCPTVAELGAQKSTVDILDAMVDKIQTVSSNGYLPQAKAFALAFRKLRLYYVQKRNMCLDADGECEASPSGQQPKVIHVFGDTPQENDLDTLNESPEESILQEDPTTKTREGYPGSRTSLLGSLSQQHTVPTQEIGNGLTFPVNDVYDPATYDSMDWNSLILDDVTMKELDEFMMDDDPSWMRSFF